MSKAVDALECFTLIKVVVFEINSPDGGLVRHYTCVLVSALWLGKS